MVVHDAFFLLVRTFLDFCTLLGRHGGKEHLVKFLLLGAAVLHMLNQIFQRQYGLFLVVHDDLQRQRQRVLKVRLLLFRSRDFFKQVLINLSLIRQFCLQ